MRTSKHSTISDTRLWSLFAEGCRSVISGWSLRHGEHSSQIQRQGLLLQGSTLSLLRRHAECKSKRGHNLRLGSWSDSNVASVVSKIAAQKYEEMFPAFGDSRECKLLKVGSVV